MIDFMYYAYNVHICNFNIWYRYSCYKSQEKGGKIVEVLKLLLNVIGVFFHTHTFFHPAYMRRS